MTETINISPQVLAVEGEALAGFYRERTLVAGQRLLEAIGETGGLRARIEALDNENQDLREALEAARSTPEATAQGDNDGALAAMLRAFVAEGARNEAAIARLMADAKIVIAREGE